MGRCKTRLAVSPPISQTLARDVLQRNVSALHIVHAQRDAVVPAEVELVDVALQVLLANVVERANQSSLQQRERCFNGVRGDRAARVFLVGVDNELVRSKVRTNGLV